MTSLAESHVADYLRLRIAVNRARLVKGDFIRWFGYRVGPLESARTVDDLARIIYSHAYVYGAPRPLVSGLTDVDLGADVRQEAPSVHALLAAREGGWQLARLSGGWCRLTKSGSPPLLVPDTVVQTEADDTFSVPVPSYSERRLPGWATLAHGVSAERTDITRLYINTNGASAGHVVDGIARTLINQGASRFLIKWLLSAQHDVRTDSTVLYVEKNQFAAIAPHVEQLVSSYTVGRDVPMFTTQLAPGLAHADDPGGSSSYGEVVSRRAAEELVLELRALPRRHVGGPSTANADRGARQQIVPPLSPTCEREPQSSQAQLLSFATQLLRDAVWNNDEAGWLSRTPVDGRIQAAGPDVYHGAPGPILALAYASTLTESQEIIRVMRAAARYVVSRLGELGHGFHSGVAGTAAVLAEAACASDDEVMYELADHALSLAVVAARTSTRQWDVIDGLAGTVLGIVAAAGLLRTRPPDELAFVLQMLVAVEREGRGWRTAVGGSRRRLDGMAQDRKSVV